jgi:tRNA pseudouridine synthase 10
LDDWTIDIGKAGAASEKGLCDRCLGRLFGKLGTGMTNVQRGQLIRDALRENGIPSEPPEACPLCGNVFDSLELFAEAAAASLTDVGSDNFLIGTRIDQETASKEKELWAELGTENAEAIKTELNREIGKLVFCMIDRAVDFKNPQVVACVDTQFADVTLDIAPIFIYGRYNKLSREIPQTIWPCRVCKGKGCPRCRGVGKMYVTSVQEIIGDIAVEMSSGKTHALHGMGREDIDALMLGTGRPFVLEVSEPRMRNIDLAELERRANLSDLAKFNSLSFVTREKVQWTKDLAPTKTYKIRVRADGKVNKERVNEVARSIRNLCIDQRTPVRVEHRRADLVRKREILWVEADWIDDGTFDLTLETGSGTYVKEFVSGDGGRSDPCFSGILGVQCRVETLDVLAVNDGKVDK